MLKTHLCKMQIKYFPENKTTDYLIQFFRCYVLAFNYLLQNYNQKEKNKPIM